MEKIIKVFEIYLNSQKVSYSSIRNYSVDIRNFLEWFTLHLKTEQVEFNEEDVSCMASLISKEKIELYKNFLLNNRSPVKTINRRLSTIRKFCSFALSQHWLSSNPGKLVTNAGTKPKQEISENEYILDEFKNDLKSEGVSLITIKNYTVDIKQFLEFLNLSN